MLAVYNKEETPETGKLIFLAGPTPRGDRGKSWRGDAIAFLEKSGFDGIVVAPEDRGFKNALDFDHDSQIAWERKNLSRADLVVFWVPREIKDMPAFTTNIEFGFVSERKQPYVLGFPVDAPKMKYLSWIARDAGAPICHTLEDTLNKALEMVSPKISPISRPGPKPF